MKERGLILSMSPSKKEKLTRTDYLGKDAEEYSRSKWMARLQINTSIRVISLLEDERIGGKLTKPLQNYIILDAGCGSGYSSVVLEDKNVCLVGLDYSFDMLEENLLQQKNIERNEKRNKIPRILINGIIEHLPFRNNIIHHVISISAFNFVIKDSQRDYIKSSILSSIVQSLKELLKKRGRIVIEFYPKKEDIEYYLRAFKGAFTGGLIIDNPGKRKEQKFLILRRED
ncbi:MAG: methyltransferase domain-containing protein [Candidatus Lokiarchaeota archaeon]|nr:methyltransferase domain-containing protein [Candidatus Lokiarchaeota archaeon]